MFADAAEGRHLAQAFVVRHILIFRAEVFLAYAADGAYPVLGEVFESGAGSYAVIGVAELWIIDVTAGVANILFHSVEVFYKGEYCAASWAAFSISGTKLRKKFNV